jgi:hypothetical protein
VGQPAVCGEFLYASWSVCGVELAAGTGPVYVSLPVPTAIQIEATAGRISCDGDPSTVLDIPTSSQLEIQVTAAPKYIDRMCVCLCVSVCVVCFENA